MRMMMSDTNSGTAVTVAVTVFEMRAPAAIFPGRLQRLVSYQQAKQ
jgi:hypothetical protein